MKIRPLQGQVLVYMDPRSTETESGIILPEAKRDEATTGKVIRCGIWKQDRKGNLIPFPVKRGDHVVIQRSVGRWVHKEKERLKLVPMERILAVL